MKIRPWTDDLANSIRGIHEAVLNEAVAVSALAMLAARKARGVPVYCDVGGCLVTTPDGDVVRFDSESETVVPINDPRFRDLAAATAAERFDEVQALGRRASDGRDCGACRATGKVAGARCADCGGLGWTRD